MGSLKPGATYIYEQSDGKVYAREFGKTEKTLIGHHLTNKPEQHSLALWKAILKESETNTTLQKAVDNVIMLYKLSRDRYE